VNFRQALRLVVVPGSFTLTGEPVTLIVGSADPWDYILNLVTGNSPVLSQLAHTSAGSSLAGSDAGSRSAVPATRARSLSPRRAQACNTSIRKGLTRARGCRQSRVRVSTINMKRGDTKGIFTDTLTLNAAAVTSRDALCGLSCVAAANRRKRSTRLRQSCPAAAGTVSYQPVAEDVDTEGVYEQEWQVTFPSTRILTFPNGPRAPSSTRSISAAI
jgi:hypothetical protein